MHCFVPAEEGDSSIISEISETSCDNNIGCGTESELENEDSEESENEGTPVKKRKYDDNESNQRGRHSEVGRAD